MSIVLQGLKTAILPAWVKPAAVLVLLVMLVAGGYWWGSSAMEDKKNAEIWRKEAAWSSARDVAQTAVAAAITREREKERLAGERLAELTRTYRKELSDEKVRADVAERRLRDRVDRVSVPVYLPASCSGAGGQDPASAAGADGTTRAELSGEAAADLDAIARDANALAIKFGALQSVVRSYLLLCGSGTTENAVTATGSAAIH